MRRRGSRTGVLLVLVAVTLGACAGAAAPSPAGDPAVVTGRVTAGPVCPVETNPPDPACAARPVDGAVIVATDAGGAEVGRTTSGPDGAYRLVASEAGPVQLAGEPVTGLMGVPDPVTVDLEAGATVVVDLVYDTGIR